MGVKLHGEDDADLGEGMAPHDQAQTKAAAVPHVAVLGGLRRPVDGDRLQVVGNVLPMGMDRCRKNRNMAPASTRKQHDELMAAETRGNFWAKRHQDKRIAYRWLIAPPTRPLLVSSTHATHA